MRAALYVRVSTGERTTENQERELRQWAGRLGFEVVKVYADTASEPRSGGEGLMRYFPVGFLDFFMSDPGRPRMLRGLIRARRFVAIASSRISFSIRAWLIYQCIGLLYPLICYPPHRCQTNAM